MLTSIPSSVKLTKQNHACKKEAVSKMEIEAVVDKVVNLY